MASVSGEIKAAFKQGDILTRLIFVNVAVFVLINVLYVFLWLFKVSHVFGALNIHMLWFGVPANLISLLFKPWTPFTYMFVHADLLHLFWNMLLLFLSGRIFSEYLGSTRMLATYIYGGLGGFLLYLVSYNVFPVFSDVLPDALLVGASASVVAILVASTTYVPNYLVRFPFTSITVKLKYIVGFMVLMDFINIQWSNPGGHIAHLGGALYGFYFVQRYKKGKDFSSGFNRFIAKARTYFYKSKGPLNVSYSARRKHKTDEEYNYEKKVSQQKMDEILDKISKSGYESLSKEEKEILFKFGNKD